MFQRGHSGHGPNPGIAPGGGRARVTACTTPTGRSAGMHCAAANPATPPGLRVRLPQPDFATATLEVLSYPLTRWPPHLLARQHSDADRAFGSVTSRTMAESADTCATWLTKPPAVSTALLTWILSSPPASMVTDARSPAMSAVTTRPIAVAQPSRVRSGDQANRLHPDGGIGELRNVAGPGSARARTTISCAATPHHRGVRPRADHRIRASEATTSSRTVADHRPVVWCRAPSDAGVPIPQLVANRREVVFRGVSGNPRATDHQTTDRRSGVSAGVSDNNSSWPLQRHCARHRRQFDCFDAGRPGPAVGRHRPNRG